METLDQLIERRTPVDADELCSRALDRFIREPAALALAVVDGAAPIGILSRESFLARMENPETAHLAVRQVLDPDPIIADVSSGVDTFVEEALAFSPSALLGGFIAVESGRYVGVGTVLSILAARSASAQRRNENAEFIQRLGDEVIEALSEQQLTVERLRKAPASEAAALIDEMELRGRDVLQVVETAVQLQGVEGGLKDHRPEPRRVQELMDEVEAAWQARAESHGVTLLCAYDGDPECIATLDAGWFHQAMDALISHALLHARCGVVEASLRTRTVDGDVVIEGRVRDNGSAHAPAYLKALFDPANPGFEKGEMGLALSLGLAGRRIGALGGTILAEANVGAGCSVAFSFTTHEMVEVAEAAPVDDAQARRAHVLVVDDNATNRMVVEALCEMFDCSTESVTDGVEAVEAARNGRFDVILMDIKMPRMDGVTATREIRAMGGPAGAAPIIALTANADPDEVREYLRAGMHCVVEKPIKPERLLSALDTVLSQVADAAAEAA